MVGITDLNGWFDLRVKKTAKSGQPPVWWTEYRVWGKKACSLISLIFRSSVCSDSVNECMSLLG